MKSLNLNNRVFLGHMIKLNASIIPLNRDGYSNIFPFLSNQGVGIKQMKSMLIHQNLDKK